MPTIELADTGELDHSLPTLLYASRTPYLLKSKSTYVFSYGLTAIAFHENLKNPILTEPSPTFIPK
jgi:hypothetical protein